MENNPQLIKKMTLKYSFVHGSYWMAFGATYNFVTVYLLSKSFTSQNIGIIVALTNIFSTIMQPYIAGLADRSHKFSLRAWASILLFICLSLSALLVVAPKTMLITAFLYFLIITVMLTTQPLLNAMGMQLINKNIPVNFGFARGMGSLSYAFISYVLGSAVEQQGPSILPYAFIALFGASFMYTYTFALPKAFQSIKSEPLDTLSHDHHETTSESLSTLGFMLKYKKFSFYLLGIVLIFICFNITNIYMIKIAENIGGNEATMGTAFAIAAILELPVMLSFSKLSKRFHNGPLLKISGLFFSVKAFLIFLAPSIPMLYFAQGFQMISYAIFVPGSIYYVGQVIKEKDQVKGQAFTTAAMTLGGVGGSLIGGFLLTQGSLNIMLLSGTLLSTLGSAIFLLAIDTKKPSTISSC